MSGAITGAGVGFGWLAPLLMAAAAATFAIPASSGTDALISGIMTTLGVGYGIVIARRFGAAPVVAGDRRSAALAAAVAAIFAVALGAAAALFAAGAGDRTATYCLYLHHIRMGELREAEYWFQQAARLEDDGHTVAIPPSLPTVPGYFAITDVCQYVPDLPVPDRGLRDVLDHRQQVSDDMVGSFSLPPEDIAEHLHALTSG
ncbi:hypothetical protein [Kitasatospora sp. P5_F3]